MNINFSGSLPRSRPSSSPTWSKVPPRGDSSRSLRSPFRSTAREPMPGTDAGRLSYLPTGSPGGFRPAVPGQLVGCIYSVHTTEQGIRTFLRSRLVLFVEAAEISLALHGSLPGSRSLGPSRPDRLARTASPSPLAARRFHVTSSVSAVWTRCTGRVPEPPVAATAHDCRTGRRCRRADADRRGSPCVVDHHG